MKKKLFLVLATILLIVSCGPGTSNTITNSETTSFSSITEDTTTVVTSEIKSETTSEISTTEITSLDVTTEVTTTYVTEVTTEQSTQSSTEIVTTTNPTTQESKTVNASIEVLGGSTSKDSFVCKNINITSVSVNYVYTDVDNAVRLGSNKNSGSIEFKFDKNYVIASLKIIGSLYNTDADTVLITNLNGNEIETSFTSEDSSVNANINNPITTNSLKIQTKESGKHRFNLSKLVLDLNEKGSDTTTTTTTTTTATQTTTTTTPTSIITTNPTTQTTSIDPTNKYFYLYDNEKVKGSRGNLGSVDSYYEPCRGLKGAALKSKLHDIICDFDKFSYDHLKTSFPNTDVDPEDTSNMILCYTEERYPVKSFSGFSGYINREHTWPDSKGVGKSGPGSDKHMQRPCEQKINSSRGNLDFGNVDHSTATHLGASNPINEGNYRSSSYFEPKNSFKGDIARGIFYMAVCYDSLEISTNNVDKNKFNYFTSSYSLGDFTDMYSWATSGLDPISDFEMYRNNKIDSMYQHNRNPFVDHPEFLIMIYDKNYSGPGALNDR